DEVHRLLTRPTLPVDGGRGRRPRQTAGDDGIAPDVAALVAGLGDAPGHDVVESFGVDAAAGDQLPQREAQQIGRVPTTERTFALPERRANDVDDYRFTNFHGLCLHEVDAAFGGDELHGCADELARFHLREQGVVFDLAVRTRAVFEIADDETPLGSAVAPVSDGVAGD